jgi:hypothetical protein
LTKIGKLEPEKGKQSSVNIHFNRTITDWNQLPEEAIGALTGNTLSFRKRIRKSEAK